MLGGVGFRNNDGCRSTAGGRATHEPSDRSSNDWRFHNLLERQRITEQRVGIACSMAARFDRHFPKELSRDTVPLKIFRPSPAEILGTLRNALVPASDPLCCLIYPNRNRRPGTGVNRESAWVHLLKTNREH